MKYNFQMIDALAESQFGDLWSARLPPELKDYIPPSLLRENAIRLLTKHGELSEVQRQRVLIIKDVLDELPLLHATRFGEILTTGMHDILPLCELPPDHRGNSLESDISLGLTRCVFMGWGLGEKSRYGQTILQISPRLLDSTFVTFGDIGSIEFAQPHSYEGYSPKAKERIEKRYFGTMVSGKIWKEVIARRILRQIESGAIFFELNSMFSLGEIKHFGCVSKELIIGSFNTTDLRGHYKYLYEHGFAFSNMELNRRLSHRNPNHRGVDPKHEDCGIDYESASNFWRNKLFL